MKYKINNKYIVQFKGKDATETYKIVWIDTSVKDKSWKPFNTPDGGHYIDQVQANNIKEALEKMTKTIRSRGLDLNSCSVVEVSKPHKTYCFTGRFSALLNKTEEELNNSCNDSRKVTNLKPGDVIKKEDGTKWNVVLVQKTPFGIRVRINSQSSPVKTEEITFKPSSSFGDTSLDAEPEAKVDLDFLIKDEIEAINGYREMIAKTSDPQILSLLSHILEEETEHVEELRAAQAGVYKVEDSVEDSSMR